jgi:hypothetical protein
MKIQLKRSNVLEGGKAKAPTAPQMEYGEIAVNYNTTDPTLFLKDSANGIVRINGNLALIEALQEELDAVEADIISINAGISTIEGDISTINNTIDVLPEPLKGIEYQANTLDDRYVSRFSWGNINPLT